MIKLASFKQINICFTDEGKGRAIVLLHGFLEDKSIWKEFSVKLSKQYRVICIDLPGFGETPGIGYVHSMEMMADCVKAVMDHLNLRRYAIVGHSMGGYVSMAFAELYPKNISGICLFHSTAAADSDEKKTERTRVIEIVKRDPILFVKNFFAKLFAPKNIEALQNKINELRKNAEKIPRQNIVNALEGMKNRADRRHLLRNINYPMLFIIGKQDSVIPYSPLLEQIKLCKDAKVLELENVAHMGFYEAEKEGLKAVKKFARKCFT
jgi:pimeloyl-ACP methyl ester carboxylesterase